jgi:adenylate cyclase
LLSAIARPLSVPAADHIENGEFCHRGLPGNFRGEALAEPGGICLSAAAYEQVRDRLDLAFDDLGEQQVKNIARPVRT